MRNGSKITLRLPFVLALMEGWRELSIPSAGQFLLGRIDVALFPRWFIIALGYRKKRKKRIREAERTSTPSLILVSANHKKVDIEKMLKRQALGSDLELAIVDCLSEQQLRECAAIYNCYLFYDSGPAHWVKVFGASILK